jgi:pyruvate, orthophosphate dikinase
MGESVFFFGDGRAEGDPARRDVLGGKGAGLAAMTLLALPVPPGFTIAAGVCRTYRRTQSIPDEVRAEVASALGRLEKSTATRLGDSAGPLLVSVRSGSRASMPGMMDTILNVGLNDGVAEALAAKTGRRFAFDAYRRFIAMHATVALGVSRDPFERALDETRARVAAARGFDGARWNAQELKRKVPDSDIPAQDVEALVAVFKGIVKRETGRDFPSDPRAQLWQAIEAVFRSWENHRALVYRRMNDIPDEWGTACNVQAMVFGNRGETSATGVAFTRDPTTGEKRLYGEWLPNAQGEDVVAGVRTPLPLRAEGRGGARTDESLEARMPGAYGELDRIASTLERHFRDMQDLEFTIEDGKLFMLQCREAKRTARAAVRIAVDMAREGLITREEAVLRVDPARIEQLLRPTLDPQAPKTLLARGLAASPGAASGHLVFTSEEAARRAARGTPVILVRAETSPEDIQGVHAARGVLTARGGMTSHAAVVARGLGKPCVAGVSAIAVSYEALTMTITQEDDAGRPSGSITLAQGDVITLDGDGGRVYEGVVPTVSAAFAGDFGELMAWADVSRTMRVRARADTALDARLARTFGAEGIGLCRTEHIFFDDASIPHARAWLLADDARTRAKALASLLPLHREHFIAIFREMGTLPVAIRLLDLPLRQLLPAEPKDVDLLARSLGVPAQKVAQRIADLHEENPAMGHRGCRQAITFPELYAMQVRAILEAAARLGEEGIDVHPEMVIPRAVTRAELDRVCALIASAARDTLGGAARPVTFSVGARIDLPRAALVAGELAQAVDFFSFGTGDLTEATLGLTRDDAGKFLPTYLEATILPRDPFVTLDAPGVGVLVAMAAERGRKAHPGLGLGVSGDHAGDPVSIGFFHRAGFDSLSPSPWRVPVARLAAAQAALRASSESGLPEVDPGV